MTEAEARSPSAGPASPCIMVIFGATGDLARRKLIPAVYHLLQEGLLPEHFAIVGVGRANLDSDAYRKRIDKRIRDFIGDEFSPDQWEQVLRRIHYSQTDIADPDAYAGLSSLLQRLDAEYQTGGNYLFYLATPPSVFGKIVSHLGQAGLSREEQSGWRRVIIEKPFGHDLASARKLNGTLHASFNESQVYRIDHYLGKETVQNILAYRFTNGTVEPIWNRRYIDHVQITVAESLGVEGRAGYYEHAGALRDMVPNHLLAVLSLVAMEPASSFEADPVRDEQTKVLRSIQPLLPEDVLNRTVRGQYGPGVMPDGTRVPGYREAPGVAPDSATETFVAMKLMIDSWRWAGVPFYLRTGKRMPGRYTEIVIEFRHAPSMMFRDSLVRRENVPPNRLVLRIQPNEGIGMSFNAKVPGPGQRLSPVKMNFSYDDYFGTAPSTGYETLLYDCMNGDPMLFKRADNIEAGWEIVEPVLDVWAALPPRDFPDYAAGTWGPPEADELLRRDGRQWRECEICER